MSRARTFRVPDLRCALVAFLLAAAATVTVACSKDTGDSSQATGLTAPSAIPAPALGSPGAPASGVVAVPGGQNPHAMPGGQNPHAMPGGQNPHAMPGGQNPHAMPGGQNPHAMPGGQDPHGAPGSGTPIANPHSGLGQAEVDPTRFLRGVLTAPGSTAPLIKKGDIVFVSVKPVDPNTGELGPTIAVDRYDVDELPVAFSLDGSDVMTNAVPFAGTVAILARVDRDGEARTALPGDIRGKAMATIPAEGIELALDQVIE